jgi:hypothetical protein
VANGKDVPTPSSRLPPSCRNSSRAYKPSRTLMERETEVDSGLLSELQSLLLKLRSDAAPTNAPTWSSREAFAPPQDV